MGSPVTREEEEDTGCPPRTPDRQRGICLSAGYVLRPLRGYSPLPPRHGASPRSAAFEHVALPFVCFPALVLLGVARESSLRHHSHVPMDDCLTHGALCCNVLYSVATRCTMLRTMLQHAY